MAPEPSILKRQRSRPSDWWAANPSPAPSPAAPPPRSQQQTSSQKEKEKQTPAQKRTPRVPEKQQGLEGDMEEIEAESGRRELKRKRKRPSDWWAVDSSNLEIQVPDEAVPEQERQDTLNRERARKSAAAVRDEKNVDEDRDEGGEVMGPKRRGRHSKNADELQALEEDTTYNKKGEKKRGRPRVSESGDERVESLKKTPRKPALTSTQRKSRPSRRRQVNTVDGVETATSFFRKARPGTGGRGRPAIIDSNGRVEKPTKSKGKGPSTAAEPIVSQSHGERGIEPSQSQPPTKRKASERSKVDDGKRRRIQEPEQPEDRQQREHPLLYQHLAPVTRKISHQIIDEKWEPLPPDCVEQISQLLSDVQRPVVLRLGDEHKRHQASTALQMISRRLVSKISRGIPFPKGTSHQREDDFNFEKIIDHTRSLEAQLTPALHANVLLGDELQKEMVLAEEEKEILDELRANAKSEAGFRKQTQRKMHPLLQSDSSTFSDLNDPSDLGLIPNSAVPILGILQDDQLKPITQELKGHLDSLQNNVKQIQGISEAMARSKAAVQVTLFDHLEPAQYDEVILGH